MVKRRRMVRRYAPSRPVPPDVVDAIMANALRGPSAGFSQGFTDRSDTWWPSPYWDIDTGFATLLMLLTAVDRGLAACFFGIPVQRLGAVQEAFGVPPQYRPIGALTVGFADEAPWDARKRRSPAEQMVHRGHW